MLDDDVLLKEYAGTGSEQAFSALVSRHINLVYAVAMRRTSDAHFAEDVVQKVFALLAAKAKSLPARTILPAWLCRTARNFSADVLRSERRRQTRERIAMTDVPDMTSSENQWTEISPLLDEALENLSPHEHDAVVLRFLDNKGLNEVGASLGISEDAARMRVNRALEALRRFFQKRGVTISTAALAAALAANSSHAAPAALASMTACSAIAAAKLSALTATHTTSLIAMTTLQKIAISVLTIGALAVAGFYARQAATTRNEASIRRAEKTTLEAEVADLQLRQNKLLSQLAAVKSRSQDGQANQKELLSLRGQLSLLRNQSNAMATAKVDQPRLASAQEYLQRAQQHQRQHNYELELQDLNEALSLDSSLVGALMSRAEVFAQHLPKEKGGEAAALADYGRVLDLDPQNGTARHNRAIYYNEIGDRDKALSDYDYLLTSPVKREQGADSKYAGQLIADEHYNRGMIYKVRGNYEEAITDFEAVLEIDPHFDNAHKRIGECYQNLGQSDKAAQEFAKEERR